MAGTGDKLMTAAEIKEVTDTKVNNDFSTLTALPNGLSDTDLINVRRSGSNYKLTGADLAPTPLVVSITSGQWSGSGSDYYISYTASNVTANSVLVPICDHSSMSLLNGAIWCVPAAGSFTIHTSAIPAGTVTVMVQFVGTLGEAQYQVLSDVYSKSQVDSAVAQSTVVTIPADSLFKNQHVKVNNIKSRRSGNVVTLTCILEDGVPDSTILFEIDPTIQPPAAYRVASLYKQSDGALITYGSIWIEPDSYRFVKYYGTQNTSGRTCFTITYIIG